MRWLCLLLIFGTPILSAQTIKPLPSQTTENLRGLNARPGTSTVWASGTHGTYLRSTDGQTFTPAQVPGAETLDFRDVEVFSAEEAYLLAAGPGDQSRIYKTIDAGLHWALQFTNSDPKGFYDCFAFWDRNHGIAVGDPVEGRFELLTTDDGGEHWAMLPEASRPQALPREGAFAASGTCIAVQGKNNVWFATGGPAARVFRSSNRGRSWRVSETPIVHGADSSGIFSIAFRDAKHGLIAGGDYQHPDADGNNLATSHDGGATWQAWPKHPQFYFSAVTFCGQDKQQFLAAGSTHVVAGEAAKNSAGDAVPANLNALSPLGTSEAVGVGPKGLLVRIDCSPVK
jgi:photosystem II stability/assembly factor-like uncharacterized protein